MNKRTPLPTNTIYISAAASAAMQMLAARPQDCSARVTIEVRRGDVLLGSCELTSLYGPGVAAGEHKAQ